MLGANFQKPRKFLMIENFENFEFLKLNPYILKHWSQNMVINIYCQKFKLKLSELLKLTVSKEIIEVVTNFQS